MARHESRKVGPGGNVTIPKDFREDLNIRPGDRVIFEQRSTGEVLIRRDDKGSEQEEKGSRRSRGR